jgi:membrane protein DedA with SNARE-associated domain
LTEQLIGQLGYLGIALILILGGLGLPIPEEAPIILAAVLSRNGKLHGPLALASCLIGVLLGDLVVYFLGYFYGEKVLSLPLTRRLLTRQREAQIKGYFHRHGFKILVSVTTFLMFGLGYAFANQIQSGIREVQQWVTVIVAAGVAIWLYFRYDKARRRAGLPVGPPVLDSDDVPLPAGGPRGPVSPERAAALAQPASDDETNPPDSGGHVESFAAVDASHDVHPHPPHIDSQPQAPPLERRARDAVVLELEMGQPQSSVESPSR